MSLLLRKLYEKDIDQLTPIMERAFDYDTKIHLNQDKGGPDGYNDGSFLRKWGLNPKATSFCIVLDDQTVGAVILWIKPDGNHFLGNIFIDPNQGNQGLGLKVWKLIESMYKDAKSWTTETPIFSHRNHHFYVNKCGFHVIRIENPKDPLEGSYILRKDMTNHI